MFVIKTEAKDKPEDKPEGGCEKAFICIACKV